MRIVITEKMIGELRGCLDAYICNTFPYLIDNFSVDSFMKRGRCECPFCETDTFIVNDRGKRKAQYRDHTYKCLNGSGTDNEVDIDCPLADMGNIFNLVPIIEGHLGSYLADSDDLCEIFYYAAARVGLIDVEKLDAHGQTFVKLDSWHNPAPVIHGYKRKGV